MDQTSAISYCTDRRSFVGGMLSLAAAPLAIPASAQTNRPTLRFGLTPVFLSSDLALLADLKAYLEAATEHPVQLVARRTYQEITALLVSRQLDAAWICGYPFVAYKHDLALVAVPVWLGRTLYQSYVVAHADMKAETLADLRGTVHAFSDPDSNSGCLVTRAALADKGLTPARFFKQSFFTYGHRNVIRAVSSGLAGGGSVDGYVYEVLREAEPNLVRATKVITKSEWLGFPPIACPLSEVGSATTAILRQAFLAMADDPKGRSVLALLRLDGFRIEPPSLYDTIAAKMRLANRAGD